MSALQEKFDKLIAEQEALRAQFQATAQELFKETTKEFFDGNPGVNAIVWTQYSPFFNDGDECVFSVNDASFTNAVGEQLDYVHYGEYDVSKDEIDEIGDAWVAESWGLTTTSDWGKEILDKIKASGSEIDIDSCISFSKMIQSRAMEDVMEAMFGNHVRIVATREGFDVQDFDHD